MAAGPGTGIRVRYGVIAVSLLLIGLVSACNDSSSGGNIDECPTTSGPGLAVAVGARANSPEPRLLEQIGAEIDGVMDRKEYVTLVRVDGDPTIACSLQFDSNARNDEAYKADRATYKAAIQALVPQVRAKADEADPLSALSIAANAAGPGGTVVLLDSGLQTVAPLDFRVASLFNAAPQAVAEELRNRDFLPDLHNRKVIVAGIGYTAAPQQTLSISRRGKLIDIWRAILVAAGAEPIMVDTPTTGPAVDGVPNVSVVDLPAEPPIDFGCNTTSELTEDEVGFVPDQTTFIDPAKAHDVLSDFAAWLNDNPSARVELVGSIAHVGEYTTSGGLSQRRAEAVREALRDLGVHNQISARGEGWGPYPTKDDPNPSEFDQQRNRRVEVTIRC